MMKEKNHAEEMAFQHVLNGSESFMAPSPVARRLYLHVLCCGLYLCGERYAVERQRYDSYLLLYVVRGEGEVKSRLCTGRLRQGDLALVDCYAPHFYGTDTGWEIAWCHFDGPMAGAFVEQVFQCCGSIRSQAGDAARQALMELMRTGESEAENHLRITRLLTLMLSSGAKTRDGENSLDAVAAYISRHFDEPLTLAQMAEVAHLSPYHFIRAFAKQKGCTPYAYLRRVRLGAARFYLRSGDMSVSEASWRCGFSSESAFCKAFRQETGMTPGAWRQAEKTEGAMEP